MSEDKMSVNEKLISVAAGFAKENPTEVVCAAKEVISSLFNGLIGIGEKIGEMKSSVELEKYREQTKVRIEEIKKEIKEIESDNKRMDNITTIIIKRMDDITSIINNEKNKNAAILEKIIEQLGQEKDPEILKLKNDIFKDMVKEFENIQQHFLDRLDMGREYKKIFPQNQKSGIIQKLLKRNTVHNKDIVPME